MLIMSSDLLLRFRLALSMATLLAITDGASLFFGHHQRTHSLLIQFTLTPMAMW